MFYGGVVVPVGARVLGSETEQGFITQSVTNYLNAAGALCLAVWLESLWSDRRSGVSKTEWAIWFFLAASLVMLVWIHGRMDLVLNGELRSVLDARSFDLFHKLYIGTSSLQWAASLLLLWLTIRRQQSARSAS